MDTFKALKKEYKGKAILYYIMGMDSINEILSWKKPLELFKICQFIVATRQGARIRTMRRILKFPPLEDKCEQHTSDRGEDERFVHKDKGINKKRKDPRKADGPESGQLYKKAQII